MKTPLIKIEDYATLLRDTYRRWRDIRPELLAGGLAFFAILSATPLLVILIGLLRLVIAKAQVMAQLDAVLSPHIGGLVREWLMPADGSGLATLTVFSSGRHSMSFGTCPLKPDRVGMDFSKLRRRHCS